MVDFSRWLCVFVFVSDQGTPSSPDSTALPHALRMCVCGGRLHRRHSEPHRRACYVPSVKGLHLSSFYRLQYLYGSQYFCLCLMWYYFKMTASVFRQNCLSSAMFWKVIFVFVACMFHVSFLIWIFKHCAVLYLKKNGLCLVSDWSVLPSTAVGNDHCSI